MGFSKRSLSFVSLGIGSVFLIVAVIGFILFPILRNSVKDKGRSHYVMIDAGSSGSRIYSYSWDYSPSTASHITEDFSVKVKPGLTSYSDKISQAGDDIVRLINQNITGAEPPVIPPEFKGIAPVRLGATAGVRLYKERNPENAAKLMNVVRQKLATTGLSMKKPETNIAVLTGAEEALTAWIANNYLYGTLKTPNLRQPQSGTYGSFEMGGASAQIAFVTDSKETKEVSDVSLYGNKMKVYRHSFLCYGQDQMMNQLHAKFWEKAGSPQTSPSEGIPHPCIFTGRSLTVTAADFLQTPCFSSSTARVPPLTTTFTFKGQMDYAVCLNTIKSLFGACDDSDKCSFNNVYQPVLPQGQFAAVSAFYFAAKFFQIAEEKLSFPQFRTKVMELCNTSWEDVKKKHKDPVEYLQNYCAVGIYMDNLLTKFGVTDRRWDDIEFVEKINGRSASWALGYLLKESAGIPAGEDSYKLEKPTYVGLMVMSGIFLLVALILFALFGILWMKRE